MPNQIPKGRRAIVMPSLLRAGGALAPRFTVAPAISGTTAIGDTLTGTITAATASPGGGTVTYAWAWQRGGADIAGASGTTTTVTSYTVVLADAVANSSLARLPLRLRVTATDSNGARTVFSNVLAGPALATDNTLTLTAGDGSTSGTNLLTNDEPAATAITAATFDGETIVLGTPLTLADRGAVTINADGTWSFNDDSDFGDVLLGLSLDRTGTYTNDVGGTATITVTVEGTAELAYSGQAHLDAEFDDLTAPTTWEIQGTQNITLTAVGSITRVDNAAAGIARTEHSAADYWSYTYMQTNPVTNFSAAVAVRVDGTTGSIFEVAGAGGAILRAYVDGSNIKAQLTDGTYDQTLTIAKPSNTTFAVGVSVDDASSTFNLTVSDGASSAATAQTVSSSTYVPFTAVTLAFGQFDGAIFAVSLKSPAAVNAASLASDVGTFVGTSYHKAGPTYADPGGLSVQDSTTATLDVSGGFSAGADASPVYSIGSVTGDWGTVSINSGTGVITYTSSDLSDDGSAGATVTVTDDYGQTASDTISVTVEVAREPTDFASAKVWLDASQETAFSSGGAAATPANWIPGQPDFTTTSGGTAPLWNAASAARPDRFTFDGTDDFIGVAYKQTIGASDGFTVIAAFRGAGGDAFGRIADMRGAGAPGSGAGWVLYRDTGVSPARITVIVDGGGNGSAWTTSIETDTADDIIVFAATYSAATGVMTVHSPISTTHAFTGMAGQAITPNDNLTVGGIAAGTRSMAGDIPEVQYLEEALSAGDVARLLRNVTARADTFA